MQRDKEGCGFACVAVVTGKSYKDIKEQADELNVVNIDDTLCTDAQDLIKLLSINGVMALDGRKAKYWENLPDLSIAGINYRKSENKWHWVVFIRTETDSYVLDPWHKIKTKKRRDFGRMRLRSAIPIVPNNTP